MYDENDKLPADAAKQAKQSWPGWRAEVEEFFTATSALAFFFALLIPAVQAFLFLKRGTWPKWNLIHLVDGFLPTDFLEWLAAPADWIGLHKILYSVLSTWPAWTAPFLTGIVLFYLSIVFTRATTRH